MSDIARVQVRLPWDSGLPEDVTVNTWHFQSPVAMVGTDRTEIANTLASFYQLIDGLMASILGTQGEIVMYMLSDPEPRVPVFEGTFSLSPGATTGPTEVALALSFQGVPSAGIPQSRKRGRVFLGPWNQTEISPTDGRPSSALTDNVRDAAAALLFVSESAANWDWVVFSPTHSVVAGQPTGFIVDNGWVDNEWDTIRSRGRRATTRDTF